MSPWNCFRCGCGKVDQETVAQPPPSEHALILKASLKEPTQSSPALPPVSQHSGSNTSVLLPSAADASQHPHDSPIPSHDSPPESLPEDWTDAEEFFTPRSHLSTASSMEVPSPIRGEIQGGTGFREGKGVNQGAAGEREEGVMAVLHGAVARLGTSALAHDLQELCDQGCFSEAHKLLVQASQEQGMSVDEMANELEAEAFSVKGLIRLEGIIQQALSVITSEKDWHVVLDTTNLEISHKQRPGSNVHSFRSRATLDCPVHHVLCLAREFDLLPSWIKYIPASAILKEMSSRELLVYFVQWMPWPVAGRDFLLTALIADLLDSHGCLVVPTNSTQLPADVKLPPGAEKRARLLLEEGSGFTVKPLPPAVPGGPERCQVCMVYQLDAGMPVPNLILEFVMKVFGPFVYRQACRLIEDHFKPGSNSAFLQRLEQHKEMYSLVETRCRALWQQKQKDKEKQQQQERTTQA